MSNKSKKNSNNNHKNKAKPSTKDTLKINNEDNKSIKKKKKLKLQKTNAFMLLCFVICFVLLIFSSYKIVGWMLDNNNIDKDVKKAQKAAKIKYIKDNDNTEIIENEAKREDPYWDFVKMDLISVDFKELKKQNKDTVGWIKVEGTNINYPYVQTNNNDFYLNHQFNKKSNGGGWVFLDYRNNPNDFNQNTIIYAHGRQNKTMFGSLKNSLTNGWLNNTNNFVVKLSTETENTLWQVFSVYRIPTTDDYLQIDFVDDEEFMEFANLVKNRSQHNFGTDVNPSDKVLTLSTCYNDDEKVVLHAKLIKREAR